MGQHHRRRRTQNRCAGAGRARLFAHEFFPAGDRAYVANSLANTLTVIDLNRLETIAEISALMQ
jgi:YVTN family beta-propeller protein